MYGRPNQATSYICMHTYVVTYTCFNYAAVNYSDYMYNVRALIMLSTLCIVIYVPESNGELVIQLFC